VHFTLLKILPNFKEMAVIQVRNRKSCFWLDNWINEIIALNSPELFSYEKNKLILVDRVLS